MACLLFRSSCLLWCLLLLSACGTDFTAQPPGKATDPQGSNSVLDGNVAISTSKGTASLTGTVEGHALLPQAAVFAPVATGTSTTSLLVSLTDQATFCDDIAQQQQRQGQMSASMVLISIDANGTTVSPGEGNYSISLSQAIAAPSQRAAGFFYANDGNCSSALNKTHGTATAGSVNLSAATGSQVRGTFSYRIGSDTIAGSFDAVPCPALATELKTAAKLKCVAP